MLERDIESKVNAWAIKTYGDAFKTKTGKLLIRKMNGLGARHWPDRLYVCARGMFFIEFKRPNEELTKVQDHMRDVMRRLGVKYFVADDVEEGKSIIDYMMGGHGGYVVPKHIAEKILREIR